MGTRSAAETIAGIFTAFFEQSTWSQAELARRLGIGTRALRLRLDELLEAKQMPLVRDQEPPHVYWSVPQGWAPGGVVLRGDEAAEMLALLARLPRSQQRDRQTRGGSRCRDGEGAHRDHQLGGGSFARVVFQGLGASSRYRCLGQ